MVVTGSRRIQGVSRYVPGGPLVNRVVGYAGVARDALSLRVALQERVENIVILEDTVFVVRDSASFIPGNHTGRRLDRLAARRLCGSQARIVGHQSRCGGLPSSESETLLRMGVPQC